MYGNTESRRAEEAIQAARTELARVARVTTVGELTVSIAHEINQPLSAIVNNANASRRLLDMKPPDWKRCGKPSWKLRRREQEQAN